MHEILRLLPAGAHVLDLGSRTGSFTAAEWSCTTICVDQEVPGKQPNRFVAARAEALPFRDRQFTAVICNHGLEHFEALRESLDEMGRVIDKNGFLFIAVPDSSTVTDRIYRWLARGGGHVNSFTSADALARRVGEKTGLPHNGTRVLCTSLAFLNRANIRGWPPKRLFLLGGGYEPVLRILTYAFRLLDRLLHTRSCVYGWALYFGTGYVMDEGTWTNVCVRCGSAHPSAWLEEERRVQRRRFHCPQCGTKNYFTQDEAYGFLR